MRISDWSSDVCSSDLGSLVYGGSDGLTVVTGLEDVVVVNTDDVVLVTKRSGRTSFKSVLDQLAANGRYEHLSHATVYRPWGSYRRLARGPKFLVKELLLAAGAAISLQYPSHRSVHWVVVDGPDGVTGSEERRVGKGGGGRGR